jgi:SulP family sulfate permease
MGALSNFLSQSVLTGFITGSACVITLSQFKYMLGIPVPRFTYTHQTIIYLLTHLPETNIHALWIGVFSFGCLYAAKQYKQRHKMPSASKCGKVLYACANVSSLLAIMVGVAAAYGITMSGGSIPVVGHVPGGLLPPGFAFQLRSMHDFVNLLPDSFILAVIGFTGNWAISVRCGCDSCVELILSILAQICKNQSLRMFRDSRVDCHWTCNYTRRHL